MQESYHLGRWGILVATSCRRDSLVVVERPASQSAGYGLDQRLTCKIGIHGIRARRLALQDNVARKNKDADGCTSFPARYFLVIQSFEAVFRSCLSQTASRKRTSGKFSFGKYYTAGRHHQR